MKRISTEIAVIGAGPAGLCAAIEASKLGAKVTLIDENALPGGQLFKQIHKFFGSKEHLAGVRGYEIGRQLLEELEQSNAEVMLSSTAYGIFRDNTIGVVQNKTHYAIQAEKIILAAGGKENYMDFPGSTLPGVMGAGAAQTMINVNRVLPGKHIVMLGSGNVGLIVSYQLMQAGANVSIGGGSSSNRRIWCACGKNTPRGSSNFDVAYYKRGLWQWEGRGRYHC